MTRFKNITKPLMWSMALAMAVIITGCRVGDGDPILGKGGAAAPVSISDVTKPRVTVTTPATTSPGPTSGPAANAAIFATFTESMDSATINSTSFTLVDTTSGGTAVAGTVSYVSSSKRVKFKPTANLVAGYTYTATIAGTGSAPVTDTAGNALAGNQASLPAASNYVWSFIPTAVDVTAPKITVTTPASGATGVELNRSVNATFDEEMDAETIDTASFTLVKAATPGVLIPGVVTVDLTNKIATLNPSSNLDASTQYTATVTTAATDLAGNALVAGAVSNPWSFTTGTGLATGAIALGTAKTFGIMATSAITCVPTCTINGDVSLDPGTSITGPPVVNGSTYLAGTPEALAAKADLLTAYNEAKGLPPGTTISAGADLGALYPAGSGGIPPGTYTSGSTMLVSTPLVLNASGDANAVWVFQIGSSLTTSANVSLLNGAQEKNVFWVPTADATIGVGSTFSGTILAGRDATAITGATINGRILAGAITAGTIALQSGTTVNVPLP